MKGDIFKVMGSMEAGHWEVAEAALPMIKRKIFSALRICKKEGCTTPLNYIHDGEFCYCHEERRMRKRK